jgi:hypothetical protein
MKARPLLTAKPPSTGTVWFILIVALAMIAGMICEWRAPGLGRYAQDSLMRARGTLAVPDDIVIVAIDEESISRLGILFLPRSRKRLRSMFYTSSRPNRKTTNHLPRQLNKPEMSSSASNWLKGGNPVSRSIRLG